MNNLNVNLKKKLQQVCLVTYYTINTFNAGFVFKSL